MRSLLLASFLLPILGVNLYAQQEYEPTYEDTLEVYEDLFYLEEPLNLTIEGNIKEFKKARRKEDYHPAIMTNQVTDSFQVSHKIRIRARGEYRRDNCTMPPYWINVRYSGIEAEEFKDLRKMKMVTRCREASQYANYVLKEYLVYKIYNIITEYSFNVRLVRVKYIDTGKKKNQITENWAFLIEPEEMLAKRLNAKPIQNDRLSMRSLNPEMMDLMALFQYMVGHGDFSVSGRHNLKIAVLREPPPVGFLPIPYDFDYTGLVNAHYAIPGETLGISSVTERYYLGMCRSKEVHMKTVQKLAESQDEILDLIMNFEYMDEDDRLDMVAYIASYFVESEQDRFVKAYLDPTCR